MTRFAIGLILIAFIFAAGPTSGAQVSNLPWCGLEQLNLDIRLLDDSPNSRGHWLVIEIRNRSKSDCMVPPFSAEFPPNGPELNDIFENTYYNDTSKSAAEFKESSRRLAPGNEAHVLLAWSSVPLEYNGIVVGDCKMHDTLTVYRGSDHSQPALEVRHLWIQSCDPIWRSSYRAGPYVSGEGVSDEWLQRVQLKSSDFAQDPVAHSARGGDIASDETKLWTLFDVQYLKGSFGSGYDGAFPLFLKTSPQVFGNCPFRSLRKREADGQTTIYVNHCEAEPTGSNAAGKQVGFFDTDFGLAPERTGSVEYEASSEVHRGGKPMLTKAKLGLFIRDPHRPMLPTIDTSTSNCHVSQLRLTSPEVKLGDHWDRSTNLLSMGEDWYDGKVFEVKNISDQSCMIGGVPDLKFQRPSSWKSGGIEPAVCRNCATPLFKPRESRWIELTPGDSAHFMVARAVSAYWPACTATGGIDMHLPGNAGTLSLPFEANFCGEIPVTAWRSGKYDGDPMNMKYDRNEVEREKTWQGRVPLGSSKVACVDNTKRKSDLPPPGPQCAEAEFAKRGRPVMSVSDGGIAFGVSSPEGKSTTVYIWLDNQTDKPQSHYVCCNASFLNYVEVYDSAGQRLLQRGEESGKQICDRELAGCGCSTGVSVAPHTLQVVDSGDLGDAYVLSAGRYFVVPSQSGQKSCESLNKTLTDGRRVKAANAVMIVIPED